MDGMGVICVVVEIYEMRGLDGMDEIGGMCEMDEIDGMRLR